MKRTDKTLLEQMQISDVEITNRMELLGLDSDGLQLLANYQQAIELHIDQIVEEFYLRQTAVDEISLLIGDADTLARLRKAQRRYILDLFCGVYDSEYVNNRLRIGLVHKRIGVEPKLYLSAVRTLKEIVFRKLQQVVGKREDFRALVDVLDRLLYFDVTLVFDTYIESLVEEIKNAKHRTEIYAKSLEVKVADRTRQLEILAKKDPLTGLFNRRAMRDMFRREISLARRHKNKLSLAYLDVDDFKQINDEHGHVKGDEVLSDLAHLMLENVRETDIPCRYGGDEFCLILPECDAESAARSCEKIARLFKKRFPRFALSIGIAETGPNRFLDEHQLIENADLQMYEAKKQKGNSISR